MDSRCEGRSQDPAHPHMSIYPAVRSKPCERTVELAANSANRACCRRRCSEGTQPVCSRNGSVSPPSPKLSPTSSTTDCGLARAQHLRITMHRASTAFCDRSLCATGRHSENHFYCLLNVLPRRLVDYRVDLQATIVDLGRAIQPVSKGHSAR